MLLFVLSFLISMLPSHPERAFKMKLPPTEPPAVAWVVPGHVFTLLLFSLVAFQADFYLFIRETRFLYSECSCLRNLVYYKNSERVPLLCKHLCTLHFVKAWIFSILAQQISWRHNRNSNKSQIVTLRYSFPFRRKLRRNCVVICFFENSVDCKSLKTPKKSQSQWLRADGLLI